jgi:ferritin-like metal-binding protein YciE
MDKYFESEELQFVYNNHKVMATLVSDSEERILRCEDFTVKDACILSCIQNINHYKIGCYGTAAAFSNVLGKNNIASLFHQFEVNEKQIDDRLSQLADYEINNQAIMHLPSNK